MKLNGNDHEMEPDSSSDVNNSQQAKRFKPDPTLFTVPTTEEAYALKNTELLYQSNLLKLQLDELLNELAVPSNKQKRFETIINDLKASLRNLKPIKNIKYSDFEMFEAKNFQMPLKGLCKCVFKDATYDFVPPKDAFVLGSYLTQTHIYNPSADAATAASVSCDLGVEIDAEMFNERDYLNYRYFIKKSLYVAHVYAQLSAAKKYAPAAVKFEFVSDYSAPYNPILCLTFLNDGFEIRLHALPPNTVFKPSRFSPNQSNVRKEFFVKNLDPNGDLAAELSANLDSDELTPRYNADILADVVARDANAYLKKEFGESKSVADAVKLLKLWLFKRGLNKGSGCFDNFVLSMYVAHLLSTRQINPLMSRYQIFRMVLLNLSTSNWHKKGLSLQQQRDVDVELFHKHFQVVFVDSTGYLNLTARLDKFTYLKLKHDANVSLRLLNDESTDNFENLFIRHHYFSTSYDSLIKIDPINREKFYTNIVKKDKTKSLIGKMIDFFNCSYLISTSAIMDLIERSLGNKAALIYSDLKDKLRWSINSSPRLAIMEMPSVLIGLNFGEKYDQELIKGPESTSPDAAKFREFWGPKSELRRFKDASICEAVYFEAKNEAKKRLVYAEIIKHILNYHLSIGEDHIKFMDNRRLNKLLTLPASISSSDTIEYGIGDARLSELTHKLDEFARLLTNLNDVPLAITSVYGVSSTSRRTDAFPPLAHYFKYSSKTERSLYETVAAESKSTPPPRHLVPKPDAPVLAPYLKPVDVCIHLESSSEWPDDLRCQARLKAAFHVKLVQLLRQAYGLPADARTRHFDVFFKGCLFRVRVCTSSELMLIRTRVNEQNVRVVHETPQSLAYERLMFDMAKLNAFVLAGVCRLAKRWLSSHFLLEYFEEEAIDLICAHLFANPGSYGSPKSLLIGFVRFLELISSFDWKSQPLIIDPDAEIKKEDLLDAKLRFQENRANLAPVYIITHFDYKKSNSTFTREKPTIQNLCRTVLQAKQSLNMLKTYIQNFETNETFKAIFKPKTSQFDICIKLKPQYCPKAYQSVEITEGTFLPHYHHQTSESSESKTNLFPVVDFDPVRTYVHELREAYGEIALFFYDLYGGTNVYMLFKPDALKPKELKLAHANYSLINESTKKFELNLSAVVDDLKLIGADLVHDVVVLNQTIFQ